MRISSSRPAYLSVYSIAAAVASPPTTAPPAAAITNPAVPFPSFDLGDLES
jgi:hypothetical protein